MAKKLSVVPAYGRDYKSKAAIKADIDAGKDFLVSDFSSPYDGKPANLESCRDAGVTVLNVRYCGLRKIAVFNL